MTGGEQSATESADYVVALNELAQLKLEEGKTEEAQQLFRQALDVQQRLGGSGAAEPEDQQAAPDDWEAAAEDDDWETRWGGELTPAPPRLGAPKETGTSAASSVPQTSTHSMPAAATRAAAAATPTRTPAVSRSQQGYQEGEGEAPEGEVPFGGAHALEVFDLTTAVKTTQLEQFLARLLPDPDVPPVVRWVDDYRALALFANPREAQRALQAAASFQPGPGQPVYNLRAFVDASALSRAMPASELKAPKPRPLTTSTVARRLIGSALNMRLHDREEEQAIQQARRNLRAARAVRREKLDEVWGDD